MTQAGIVLGTAPYMSPEQAKGRPVDRRADIWAFGAVLFEMLTGTRAFPGEDGTDTIVSVISKEPDWSAVPAWRGGACRRRRSARGSHELVSGRALSAVHECRPQTNTDLWVVAARQLTHFTDERQIADAAWSRDATLLAIARTTTATDIARSRA